MLPLPPRDTISTILKHNKLTSYKLALLRSINDVVLSFQDFSLWGKALCIHKWCLLTERASRKRHAPKDHGEIHRLHTARPANRRPLT